MKTDEVARALAISESQVRAHARDGNLKAYKFGRDWAFDSKDVIRFKFTKRGQGRPKREAD